MLGSRAVCLLNGRIVTPQGEAGSLRFRRRVIGIDDRPRSGDVEVDLGGAFVLPGLINAHDHLELNHYGRLKPRERYANASAWIDDMGGVVRRDPLVRRNQAFALSDRLFIGALKNLLAGTTTVAHHNPWYRGLRDVPVRVVRRYGWAHSLALQDRPVGARGEPGGNVGERCASTPRSAPFIVHAAEGVDDAAACEFSELRRRGCLRPNTVFVHGVGFTGQMWRQVCAAGAGLVWCPASNRYLFGSTIDARAFLDAADNAGLQLALGTDSRVTGARDLLDEIRVAQESASTVSVAELLRMVTTVPARLLHLTSAGRIEVGCPADLLIIPPRAGATAAGALVETRRSDVWLVALGGRPLVGSPALSRVFAARTGRTRTISVDGVPRAVSARLAEAIARCPITEPGVDCAD